MIERGRQPRSRCVTGAALPFKMRRRLIGRMACDAVGLIGVIEVRGLPGIRGVTQTALAVKVRIGLVGGVA